MVKTILACLSAYLCIGALSLKNWVLSAYWSLVCYYWIVNLMEGLK